MVRLERNRASRGDSYGNPELWHYTRRVIHFIWCFKKQRSLQAKGKFWDYSFIMKRYELPWLPIRWSPKPVALNNKPPLLTSTYTTQKKTTSTTTFILITLPLQFNTSRAYVELYHMSPFITSVQHITHPTTLNTYHHQQIVTPLWIVTCTLDVLPLYHEAQRSTLPWPRVYYTITVAQCTTPWPEIHYVMPLGNRKDSLAKAKRRITMVVLNVHEPREYTVLVIFTYLFMNKSIRFLRLK